jgi:hypothetical protein
MACSSSSDCTKGRSPQQREPTGWFAKPPWRWRGSTLGDDLDDAVQEAFVECFLIFPFFPFFFARKWPLP